MTSDAWLATANSTLLMAAASCWLARWLAGEGQAAGQEASLVLARWAARGAGRGAEKYSHMDLLKG